MSVVQMVKGEKEKVCCLLGIMEMIGVSRLQGDCSLFQKCCSISVSLFLDVSVCMCVLIPMDEYVHVRASVQIRVQLVVYLAPCLRHAFLVFLMSMLG